MTLVVVAVVVVYLTYDSKAYLLRKRIVKTKPSHGPRPDPARSQGRPV